MLFRVLLFTILTIPVLNAGNKNLKVQGVYGCLNNAIGNGTVITAILSDSYKTLDEVTKKGQCKPELLKAAILNCAQKSEGGVCGPSGCTIQSVDNVKGGQKISTNAYVLSTVDNKLTCTTNSLALKKSLFRPQVDVERKTLTIFSEGKIMIFTLPVIVTLTIDKPATARNDMKYWYGYYNINLTIKSNNGQTHTIKYVDMPDMMFSSLWEEKGEIERSAKAGKLTPELQKLAKYTSLKLDLNPSIVDNTFKTNVYKYNDKATIAAEGRTGGILVLKGKSGTYDVTPGSIYSNSINYVYLTNSAYDLTASVNVKATGTTGM